MEQHKNLQNDQASCGQKPSLDPESPVRNSQNDSDGNQHIPQSIQPVQSGYEGLVVEGLDGKNEISVLVSGVHCAGCIQKIESYLAKEQDLEKARLNFSTGRLAIAWQGNKERANDFVNLVEKLGYSVKPYDAGAEQDETERHERFLLLCLGIAGFAMGNIMLLSIVLWSENAETMGIATRDLFHWISGLIAIPAILFSGRPFFRSALKALSAGHTNMDVPISLALVLATTMSVSEIFKHGEHVYFDSAVMLMFFLLIGRYLDFRARKNARSSATDLLSTLSGFARVVNERTGTVKRMAIRDLREDMVVQVASGETFPVDGLIESGQSSVDTSLVTGETLPRDVRAGAQVYAGTLNVSNTVKLRVEQAAEDSLLADVVRLMEQAGQGQAVYVRIADRAAKLYTPVVHSLALLAFLGWVFIGGLPWQDSVLIAITVLIITCPCALGLAVPVTQVLASGRLMKAGILIKSGDALERLAKIDLAIFDKTGTLTLGKPFLKGEYNPDVLQKAASLASQSRHPLSQGLAESLGDEILEIEEITEHPGQGIEGVLDGKNIKLGSRVWCGDDTAKKTQDLEMWFAEQGKKPQQFLLQDVLRKDAKETLEILSQQNNIQLIMLSGDREIVAQDIAEKSGIAQYFAEKNPAEKYKILEGYQTSGHQVLMVGDGLNDAPVLAAANVSIAPGTAIDMAQNAADIVFMGEKLNPVLESYKVASLSQKLVRQNFMLAIGYNVCVIPLALAGMVTPMIAALAMSGSSLIVIANSFRIKWSS